MTTLLLADLHLPQEASPYREAFLRFCLGPARRAQQVFLLGDLFEVWLGDAVSLPEYPEEIAALQALTASGVRVAVQRGNRDFLLGKGFARATGTRLMADEEVIELAGTPTLLAHGDAYCTDDHGYQRWRRFSRNPISQWLFHALSEQQKRRIAGGLRSDTHKRRKPDGIMDVNTEAIDAAFRRHPSVTRMIHGHTHRPARHALSIDGRACERLVLPDWRPERMEWLKVKGEDLHWRSIHPVATEAV